MAEKQEKQEKTEKSAMGEKVMEGIRIIARVEGEERVAERRKVSDDAHFWVHCPPRGGTGLILAAARHRAPDKTKRLLACMWLLLGFFYVAK